MNKKNIFKTPYIYLITIFIFMFLLNSLTSFVLDDYYFMFKFNSNEKIRNLYDIIIFLKDYYLQWSGRIVANFFSLLFTNMPKVIFNICNSLVYTANIFLIFKIFDFKKEKKYYYLLLIHILLFIFFPVFGHCFVWLSGSCNYSFTLFFELLFLHRILNVESIKEKYLFQSILGLLAGMGNENSSLAILIISFLLIFMDKKNIKFHLVSFISILLGYLILICAPGNYMRVSKSGEVHILKTIAIMFKVSIPLIIGFSLIIFSLFKYNKKVLKTCILLLIGFVISYFSMAASPEMPIRTFNLAFIFLFIIFLIFLDNCCPHFLFFINTIVIIFLFSISFFVTIKEYYSFNSYTNKTDKLLIQSAKSKKNEIYAPNYTSKNCRIPVSCGFYFFAKKPNHFPNDYMKKYYGIAIYSEQD